jgi:hypothetical protein
MAGTTWDDWVEWKERCALARCREEVASRLAAFAQSRLRRAATRAAGMTNLPAEVWKRLPADPVDAWHLFETHAVLTHTRVGKAYKEWLFARIDSGCESPLDAVCGGAALMLRDVARCLLSRECLPRHHVSLDAPVAGGDGVLTYGDLLPSGGSPADDLVARERLSWAASEAEALFASLDRCQRMVLAARLHGIAVSHPLLLAATGWRHARACQVCTRIVASIRPRLEAAYPEESQDAQRIVAAELLQRLEKRVNKWISVEMVLPTLFQGVAEE